MEPPLSTDLRVRLLAAVDDEMICRAVAARFFVAPSTAIRWYAERLDVEGARSWMPKADLCRRHGISLHPGWGELTCSPDCYQSEVESGSFMMCV
jgi:hypothetical protein